MPIRTYGVSVATAAAMAVAAVVVALSYDLPIRDPDSVAGPTYVRLPVILAVCFLTDVIPRAVLRARRSGTGLWQTTRAVIMERWNRERLQLVGIGLGSWYITYVAFRNLKSWMPMVRDGSWDATFAQMDEALVLGQDPGVLLHQLLGRGIAAEVMSFVYIAWLVFIPISLAAALVWTRDVRRGMWYITAVSFDWVLGVALYYAFPTVGPVYAEPEKYTRLAETPNSRLAAMMLDERAEVLADPWTTDAVQNIAAFASLHVAITVTAVIIAWRVGLSRWLRQGLLAFLGLTVLATVYLGWHYLVDALGGFVVGALAAYLAGLAMGSGQGLSGDSGGESRELNRVVATEPSAGVARFAGRSTP